jgi:hypothetical protein
MSAGLGMSAASRRTLGASSLSAQQEARFQRADHGLREAILEGASPRERMDYYLFVVYSSHPPSYFAAELFAPYAESLISEVLRVLSKDDLEFDEFSASLALLDEFSRQCVYVCLEDSVLMDTVKDVSIKMWRLHPEAEPMMSHYNIFLSYAVDCWRQESTK